MSDSIVDLESGEQLTTIIEENDPVLLDFNAEWCGPCKQMHPVMETLADETDATVVSVDIDDHTDIANKYQVRSVPTFIIISDGDFQERVTGVQNESKLRKLVTKY